MSKIAFIVPVWNTNEYLSACLESISMVEFDNEIIVIDDCGTEDPWPIIKKFINYPNFKYIKNKTNIGLGFSRNVGIENISSDVTHVMFVDSDDIVFPASFKNIDLKNGVSLVTRKYIKLTNKSNLIYTSKNFVLGTTLPYYVWGQLWDVNIIKKCRFRSRIHEDAMFIVDLSNIENNIFEFCDLHLYGYRWRSSSISRVNMTDESLQQYVNSLNYICENMNSINYSKREFNKWIGHAWETIFWKTEYSQWKNIETSMPKYNHYKIHLRHIAIILQKMFSFFHRLISNKKTNAFK